MLTVDRVLVDRFPVFLQLRSSDKIWQALHIEEFIALKWHNHMSVLNSSLINVEVRAKILICTKGTP